MPLIIISLLTGSENADKFWSASIWLNWEIKNLWPPYDVSDRPLIINSLLAAFNALDKTKSKMKVNSSCLVKWLNERNWYYLLKQLKWWRENCRPTIFHRRLRTSASVLVFTLIRKVIFSKSCSIWRMLKEETVTVFNFDEHHEQRISKVSNYSLWNDSLQNLTRNRNSIWLFFYYRHKVLPSTV